MPDEQSDSIERQSSTFGGSETVISSCRNGGKKGNRDASTSSSRRVAPNMAVLILLSSDGKHVRVAVAKDETRVGGIKALMQAMQPHTVAVASKIYTQTVEHAKRVEKEIETEGPRLRGKFYRADVSEMIAEIYLAASQVGVELFTASESAAAFDDEVLGAMDAAFT